MTTGDARLVFFGTEAWGVPGLEALLAAGLPVVAVATKPDAPTGRGRRLTPSPIKVAALKHNLTVIEPEKGADLTARLAELKPTLGVLIAYGKIIPQSALDLFPLGIINLHPSALPLHRGPSPIEQAILDDTELGHYSIIRLSAAMDAGDIVRRGGVSVTHPQTITAPELYERVGHTAAADLAQTAVDILAGTAAFEPQDHSRATITSLIAKNHSTIDWARPADAIARKVRAHAGWPGSTTELCGVRINITAARPGDSRPMLPTSTVGSRPGTPFRTQGGELAVTTGHGELIIDRLIPAGKREMTGQAFLAGHPLPEAQR